ncbi:glycoside hydrolase family 3 N-terminal domain-containing protein [Planctomycetota bacterium]
MDKKAYQNPSLPAEVRVADLISHMSLEEKVAQMLCIELDKATTLVNEDGNFDLSKAQKHFKDGHGLGQVGRPSNAGGGKNARDMAVLTNDIQKFFLEHSRLGIPVVFHEECLHGQAAIDGTSFSQPIGLGATFDPDLVQRLYAMTAKEARLRGTHQALTPVVDVARDPRWGRVEETYGEDPYLVAYMGMAAVRGFQGDATFKNKDHVIATLKHFAAHGQPESGTNCGPVNVSTRVLREIFLYPFKKAIQEAGCISVMGSYNEIDAVPSHANQWLLRNVLREEWGFQGYVVSDYYAIRELNHRPDFFGHRIAPDGKTAALLAAQAGVNIELPDRDCYPHLVERVQEGTVSESLVDELIAPMLEWKFKMGLFDDPYVDPALAEQVVGCESHCDLALEAAHKTITLLKNENQTAPLNLKQLKTIAVIGPNADRPLLGGYSGKPAHVSTVLEGIREHVGDAAEVLYHEGCKITIGGAWEEDDVVPNDPRQDRVSMAAAVKVAEQADVIVLAIGGNEQTSREAWAHNHMGDRPTLQMAGLQDELVDAMVATGKPVIALLFNGRPLAVANLAEKVPTIFECWYLGQETGRAVADVLVGEVNPGGKLPITIPRSVGHVPAFYNYTPMSRRGYLMDEISPLFAFGYGLSYTQFSFSQPQLTKSTIKTTETTHMQVTVTNCGSVTGDEVVQVYIRDCFSSVARPVKELKGFQRICLEPGQRQTVTQEITPEHLSFYTIDMDYGVEPGEFMIMVGNSSRDEDLQTVKLTVEQ